MPIHVLVALLSNIYLTEVDGMLERAQETTRLRKLKDVFRRRQSQPIDRVIKLINQERTATRKLCRSRPGKWLFTDR